MAGNYARRKENIKLNSPGDKNVASDKSNENKEKDISTFIKNSKIKQRTTKGEKEDANSFGEIEFVGFGQITQNKAPYIRVDKEIDPKIILDLLLHKWRIPRPKIVISVIGGHKNFFLKDDRLKILLSKGLFKAAVSTGAWLVTEGTASGVTKLVGEAIKEESQGTTKNEVVALGITYWNLLNNKEVLKSSSHKGCWPAKYAESDLKLDKDGNYASTILECNHTHFILVDHGEASYKVDTYFRAELVKYIAKHGGATNSTKKNTEVPVVLVVVDGGSNTIKTTYQSLEQNGVCDASTSQATEGIPIVIIKGSGRAADVIAEAYLQSERQQSDDGKIKSALRKMVIYNTRPEKTMEECFNWVKQIIAPRNRKLITVFQMDDENFKDIDKAILHGVLQAKTLDGNVEEQLKLAVALNRCDIAKDHIITPERRQEWQRRTDSMYDIVSLALTENKTDFVEFFLAHIVHMDRYLTYNRLGSLYNEVVYKDVSDAESRISTRHILRVGLGSQKPENVIEKVYSFLRKLTEDEYDALYQAEPKTRDKQISDPDTHLFLWAVLLNRRTLALMFWKRLTTGNIGAALIAGRILRALSAYAEMDEEVILHNDLVQHADEFEKLATGVLESCYEADKDICKLLLVRTLPVWGNTTCLSIAYSAKQMNFMKHDCCQSKLQRVWNGNLLIHSKTQWLAFFMGTVLPIFPFMRFLVDRSYDPAEIHRPENDGNSFANYFLRWRSVQPKKENEVRKSGFKDDDITFWEGMRYYYTAPITKFVYNMVSYIILLVLFAIFILTDLRPYKEANSPGTIEIIVAIWIMTSVVEEVRQLIVREPKSKKYKAISWFSEVWNRFDLVMYLLFVVSFLLRFILPPSKFATARVMYCLTFIAFCVRLLHMGFVFKEVGPKIIMIIKMIKDLTYFLFILIVFIAGFGIANEAILYPNMDPHFYLMVRSLYKPYWQLYGALFLEEIEGRVENETCYEDPRFMNVCPQVNGYRWVAPTLTAIYMLISNILLINLLIAMFSFTFQRVQDNAEVIWRFYRVGFIREYQDRPTLAPPLIIINEVYRFIIYMKNRKRAKESHSLCVRLGKGSAIDERLNLFERKHLQNYFIKENQRQMTSVENTITSTDKRVDEVVNDVGSIKECLTAIQNEVGEIKKGVTKRQPPP